jgi:hypothetical protein
MKTQDAVNPKLAPRAEARPGVRAGRRAELSRLVKAGSLSLLCLLAGLSSRGFTLYNGNLHLYGPPGVASPPAADFDSPPDADFSDCINSPNDHWVWPVNNALNAIVITYAFDSSFDNLFAGAAPGTEQSIKTQIELAAQQWELGVNSQYGWFYYGQYDSYARANLLSLDVQHSQTIAPFMDVRSAAVHELGHILGFAHCDQGANAHPVANFAYFLDGN